jgi:alanyl-tRNA synthetase
MDIRKKFLDYFKSKEHLILPSSGLIPENDPSVLLTTAGMQQFKPFFLGTKKPPASRIATVQKCFRTSDIDSVGYTNRHCTFFEMLGNFSFGDYFKREAIVYALDFILNIMKIPIDKIFITVFKGGDGIKVDKEAIKYWKESGIADDRIYKFGKEENFWGPAGETGPCGPCSEIHYDFGKEYGCGKKTCGPNCDCGRFIEIWNLVFTEYDFDGKNYKALPKKNIDTGMGLERMEAVIEGEPSIFKTDLFKNIVKKVLEISKDTAGNTRGHTGKGDSDFKKAVRIIADHSRAIYFMISDGVSPSNEGRGYILRRIIRRAVRFGRQIGINEYFLNKIGEVIVNEYADIYPEILEKKDFSFKLVDDEEKRFTETLKEGSKVLLQKIKEIKKDKGMYLDSGDAFRLYDTYGFPVELTGEILGENGLKLNRKKFDLHLKKHQEKSKNKKSFDKRIDKNLAVYQKISRELEVEFTGYQDIYAEAVIENIVITDKNDNKKVVSYLSEGEKGEIILENTPFYGEKGGQIGDRGMIKKGPALFEVEGCIIPVEGIYTHKGILKKGTLKKGDRVSATVDQKRRKNISRNHTATHLLHWALRNVFGKEVRQSGSFVDEDKFRFDYSIYSMPTKKELGKVEQMINEKIQNNDTVRCFETTREFAEEIGAISLFDEKYGKFVRVVEIDNYSRELCGGIHVKRTGDIGIFKITAETGVGANLRRIEGVTGMYAYNYLREKEAVLSKISSKLEVDESRAVSAVEGIKKEIKEKEEELASLKIKAVVKEIADRTKTGPDSGELKIIDFDFSKSRAVSKMDIKSMGSAGDHLKKYFKDKNTFLIFTNIINKKPVMVLQATDDLIKKGIDCSKLAGEAGKKIKGGGGGKPGYAQLGGSDSASLSSAVRFVKNKVLDILKKAK